MYNLEKLEGLLNVIVGTDLRIIDCLYNHGADGRRTAEDIKADTHIAESTVYRRLKVLRALGIVKYERLPNKTLRGVVRIGGPKPAGYWLADNWQRNVELLYKLEL
jgi:predicted transcriptional regulator